MGPAALNEPDARFSLIGDIALGRASVPGIQAVIHFLSHFTATFNYHDGLLTLAPGGSSPVRATMVLKQQPARGLETR